MHRSLFLTTTSILMLAMTCGCEDTSDRGGDGSNGGPVIVELAPEPGDDAHFFETSLWVRFDSEPSVVTLTLQDNEGLDVPGQQSQDELTWTLDPVQSLQPSTAYTLVVDWVPSDAPPLEVAFQTSAHGTSIPNETALVDATFEIDVANATFIEPPGLATTIGSLLENQVILIAATSDSDFAADALHVIGAIGTEEGGQVLQKPCEDSLTWTHGADGIVGTSDDQPADWTNPRFSVGPADLTLTIQGVQTRVYDVSTGGVIHPDLDDMQGGSFAGILDTRSLDGLLTDGGSEGATCELAAELGIDCQECPEEFPGPFCLYTEATDIVARRVPGLVLETLTCADVLDRVAAGTCNESIGETYDLDGDGVHELCPEWVP